MMIQLGHKEGAEVILKKGVILMICFKKKKIG